MDPFESTYHNNNNYIKSPFEDDNNKLDDLDTEINDNNKNKKTNKKQDLDNLDVIDFSNSSTNENSNRSTTVIKENTTIKNKEDINFTSIRSSDVVNNEWFPGNSLKEPIYVSFKRDLDRILKKVKFVLRFKRTLDEEEITKEFKDWDMWGPFVLCLLLAW